MGYRLTMGILVAFFALILGALMSNAMLSGISAALLIAMVLFLIAYLIVSPEELSE